MWRAQDYLVESPFEWSVNAWLDPAFHVHGTVCYWPTPDRLIETVLFGSKIEINSHVNSPPLKERRKNYVFSKMNWTFLLQAHSLTARRFKVQRFMRKNKGKGLPTNRKDSLANFMTTIKCDVKLKSHECIKRNDSVFVFGKQRTRKLSLAKEKKDSSSIWH